MVSVRILMLYTDFVCFINKITKCAPKTILEKQLHLRLRMTNHRLDIFHQHSDIPVSQHAIAQQKTKIGDCYNLKGINKLNSNECQYTMRNILVNYKQFLY